MRSSGLALVLLVLVAGCAAVDVGTQRSRTRLRSLVQGNKPLPTPSKQQEQQDQQQTDKPEQQGQQQSDKPTQSVDQQVGKPEQDQQVGKPEQDQQQSDKPEQDQQQSDKPEQDQQVGKPEQDQQKPEQDQQKPEQDQQQQSDKPEQQGGEPEQQDADVQENGDLNGDTSSNGGELSPLGKFERLDMIGMGKTCSAPQDGVVLPGDQNSKAGYLLIFCTNDVRRVNLDTFKRDLRFPFVKNAHFYAGFPHPDPKNNVAVVGGSKSYTPMVWLFSTKENKKVAEVALGKNIREDGVVSVVPCWDLGKIFVAQATHKKIYVLNSKTLKIEKEIDAKMKLGAAVNGDTSEAGRKGNCGNGKPLWFAGETLKGGRQGHLIAVNPKTDDIKTHKSFFDHDLYDFHHISPDRDELVILVRGRNNWLTTRFNLKSEQYTPKLTSLMHASNSNYWFSVRYVLDDYENDRLRSIYLANGYADRGIIKRLAMPDLEDTSVSTGQKASTYEWGAIKDNHMYFVARTHREDLSYYPLVKFSV